MAVRALARSGEPRRTPLTRGSARPAPSDERRRILVADDEPAVLLLLRINLPLAGFDVVEATNGVAALALAREQEFDLLVLDVMMPQLSGFEVAAALRADPTTAETPIVFVSARADDADIETGRALGAIDYVTKPFDPVLLGDRLRAALDHSSS